MRFLSAAATLAALTLCSASVAAPGQALAPPTAPVASKTAPQVGMTPASAPGAAGGRPLTAPDLEAWLDGYMPYALQRGDVAGAVIVVVKDGQVLLQKGYGYADVAKRKPVDPAATLFRPGSTSKLFTWTAVMQQVEQGKINLDADINTYLDFRIEPGPGGKPITMRDVMTHTAGFEEAVKDLITTDIKKLPPLGAVVKRWTPSRIYAAGSTPAYSNYATALAGYVVERTSGIPFDDYVERNLFAPLGMTNSSFRGRLPPALAANMSLGYELGSGKPKPYELIGMAPAGSLASTGSDMARFMIAHLQQGAYGDKRILRAETAQMMHSTGRTSLPPLNRMALGFYETNINGRRVISHGGDTQWFHSNLHLFLDDGVGIFISLNSLGKEGAAGPIRGAIYGEFADRYLPGPAFEGQMDPKVAAEHAKMIAGTYDNSRRVESSLVSVVGLLGEAKVVANPDGTITFSVLRGFNDVPKKWREISPFVWADVDGGKERLAAKVENGRVVRFGVDPYPFMVFEPTPAAKSGAWLLPAAGASLAALLLTVILWPITAIVRRRYGQSFPLHGQEARAYRLVRIGAAASALSIVAWIGTVLTMFGDLALLSAGMDAWIWALHILGSLGVFAGLGLAIWNLTVVWKGKRSWFAKLWSVVLVLSTLVLTWLAIAFHLVGLGANY
ncbi:serine hydrolase domain-containing protein [Caulobacter sp. DWR1-3-2b1]|uniref:serine hydrolase domain-containing protein n=1 Tax=Caulobacter sp. DWR1-3-2b1 TaxID=2804670 RepID=UPI003CEB7B94